MFQKVWHRMFYGKCSNTFESHRVSIDKAPVLSKTLNGIRVFESSIERIHANGGNSIMPLVRIFTSFRVQFVGYIAGSGDQVPRIVPAPHKYPETT